MIEIASLLLAVTLQVTPPPPPPVLATATPAPSTSPALPAPSPALPAPSLSPVPPALVAVPQSLAMNPAQQRTVAIQNAAGPLSIVSDRQLVATTIDPSGSIVVSASQATGNDVLHVSDSTGARVDIPVRVAFNAGSPPDSALLQVTGSPIDPAWLASQAQSLVSRLTLPTLRPGARLSVATPTELPTAAAALSVPVTVQVTGNGTDLDVAKTTNVNVSLVNVSPAVPAVLFYDDDPERIEADGVLYRGTVSAQVPARLYFYHDAGPDPRRVVIVLSTQSAQPSSVQVVDATAGPNIDVMSVGHAVTRSFLVEKAHNQGIVLDPASTVPYVVRDLPMTFKQGAAGTLDLQVLSGGPVTITVLAASPGVDPATLLNAPRLPGDGHHRTGAFSLAGYGNESAAYAVGGPDAKVVYADRSPSPHNLDPQSDGHDFGDYGVLHTITFALSNPTQALANAYLYERPIGGIVRSAFLVDGSLIDVGCVRRSVPYQIAAYALSPGQQYRLVVQTMTDGGSNYPIEVGISSIAPLPSAPPISAPDGCFPKPQEFGPVPAPSPSPTPSSFPTQVPISTPTARF